jgi:hypothetical protein
LICFLISFNAVNPFGKPASFVEVRKTGPNPI